MKKLNFLPLIAFCFIVVSCNNHVNSEETSLILTEELDSNIQIEYKQLESEPEQEIISSIEEKMIEAGLINIQDVDSTILVNVLYATDNNFLNRIIYDGYDKVYLQKEIAERLSKAQKSLKAIDSTLSLIVFDGARPRSIQQEMWDAMDTIPFNERTKFLSNPANGSIHNYGCAVDLSILDLKTGYWFDMGAGYDDLRKIAYPRHEEYYLSIGELTKEQIDNRKLLRKVMRTGGFWVIETEWWHFNGMTRDKAKKLYKIIE